MQRFGLGNGARESVEHEAGRAVRAAKSLSDHGDDEVVGHELARIHDALGLAAERGAFAHGGPQHVAARDLRNTEMARKESGLGPFARARAAK